MALLGLCLTLALLVAAHALFMGMAPDPADVRYIGRTDTLADLVSGQSLLFMFALSFFLMMPILAVFAGLFLPDIAAAVEVRHYPFLPPAPVPDPPGLMIAAVNLTVLIVMVNPLAILFGAALIGPLLIPIYWALNGTFLGRFLFLFNALRRLPRHEARAMRKRNRTVIWGAGTGTAVALLASVPIVNLFAPLLGVAAFAHLYHRLAAAGR